jgi:iron uptake system component EfeO
MASLAFGSQLTAATTGFTTALSALQVAAAGGDLTGARTDELTAQADYDAFRTLAAAAPPDVPRIDLLASDVASGQTFGGLHAIERDLWTSGPVAADVTALVGQTPLQHLMMARPLLVTRQWFDPEAIGSTAVDELGWVGDDALPVEQEQYSHLGLVDIDATTQAADQAFTAIEPLAHQVAPALTGHVGDAFTSLNAEEHVLGDPASVSDSTVTPAARLALSRQIDATASTLAALTARLTPYGASGGGS